MKKFEDKVALVTGGGSGIGRETAIQFAQEGAKVIVGDISEKGGKDTVDLIKAFGGEATFVKVDVSRAEDQENLVNQAVDLYGSLDVAFNNAGIEAPITPIGDHDVQAWERVISINLTGIFLALKYQVPQMIKQGGGSIINTASMMGVIASGNNAAYVTSKHGVVGLTKAAAVENSRHNVRINSVAPGVIETEMVKRTVTDEMKAHMLKGIPANKLGQPSDIAKAVLFLASEESSYINGHNLLVDGAMTIQ